MGVKCTDLMVAAVPVQALGINLWLLGKSSQGWASPWGWMSCPVLLLGSPRGAWGSKCLKIQIFWFIKKGYKQIDVLLERSPLQISHFECLNHYVSLFLKFLSLTVG